MLNKLTDLFTELEKEFPYRPGFLGAHHLIKDRETGMLILNVWWESRLWRISLTKEEDFDVPELIISIREMITEHQKSQRGLTK